MDGLSDPPLLMLEPATSNGCLFHDQVILYGFDSCDTPGDFNGFIDGLLRINKTAQLNNALVNFDTNLDSLIRLFDLRTDYPELMHPGPQGAGVEAQDGGSSFFSLNAPAGL